MIPFTLTNSNLTVVVDGNPHSLPVADARYRALRDAVLAADWAAVPTLLAPGGALARYLAGHDGFAVQPGGAITYQGWAIPEGFCARLGRVLAEGGDPAPFVKFFLRLEQNPSARSREQLFAFLDHVGIPLEPDGTFLAYKGVREDYRDVHSGTNDNTPGAVHEVPRNRVSDDPRDACHYGLHVGSVHYAASFGPVVVICRVAPEDVVCVPFDSSYEKMRTCRYEVVGEWNGQALASTVEDEVVEASAADEARWFDEEDEPEDESEDDDDAAAFERQVAIDAHAASGYVEADDDDAADARHEALTAPAKPRTTPADRFGVMTPAALMAAPIGELRGYASAVLKITGASKIPGGKAALVAKILKVRRARKRAR